MEPDPAAMRVHRIACERRQVTYLDPTTGAMVFTATYLEERGFCCASGCRHCPYTVEEQEEAGRPPEAPVWR